MKHLSGMTVRDFEQLPLLVRGCSKEVRRFDDRHVVIKFLPSVYSFTHKRAGVVEGSDLLRVRCADFFARYLTAHDVEHAYLEASGPFVLARPVLPCALECQRYGVAPFDDLYPMAHRSGPIEVVVKQHHEGTPKHRYHGMEGMPVRTEHLAAGRTVRAGQPYPQWVVRFDWRNPMHDEHGVPLADEVLPEPMADWFIDVTRSRETALKTFRLLTDFLAPRGVSVHDICMFLDTSGSLLFGEVSPDCARFRRSDGASLDKDVWRQGGAEHRVLAAWAEFTRLVELPTVVIDGNDGLGKTTLVEQLRARGYIVNDRGVPTYFTDHPDKAQPKPGEIYIILDGAVATSRARLAAAQRDLTEQYHTVPALTYYRERFRWAAEALHGKLISAEGSPEEVLHAVLAHLPPVLQR